jgi:hypothetical protein
MNCIHDRQEFESIKDGIEWFKCLECKEFIQRYIDCLGG